MTIITRETVIAELQTAIDTCQTLEGMEEMVAYFTKEISDIREMSDADFEIFVKAKVGRERAIGTVRTGSAGSHLFAAANASLPLINFGKARAKVHELRQWEEHALILGMVDQVLVITTYGDYVQSHIMDEPVVPDNVTKAIDEVREYYNRHFGSYPKLELPAITFNTGAPKDFNNQMTGRLRSLNNPLDVLHDPEHIYFSGGKLGPDIDPITPHDELPFGDYKFKPNVVQAVLPKSFHGDEGLSRSEIPNRLVGESELYRIRQFGWNNIEQRFNNVLSQYSSKHRPSIVEDQYKTKAFTNVIPAEHAQRMINDLNHLITITTDVEYAASLSEEVQRLQYIADARITKASDVNYAWVMVPGLYDRKELHLKDEGLDLYGKPDDLEETGKDS